MSEHKRLWETWSDYYYLKLIDKCLNHVPEPPSNFNEMIEAEVDAWLRSLKIEGKTGDTAGYNSKFIYLQLKGFARAPSQQIKQTLSIFLCHLKTIQR